MMLHAASRASAMLRPCYLRDRADYSSYVAFVGRRRLPHRQHSPKSTSRRSSSAPSRPACGAAGFPKHSIVGGPGLGPRRPGLLRRRQAIAIAVVAAKQRRRFPIASYPSSHERKRPSLRNPAHAAALSYTTRVRLPFGCGHIWEAIEDLAAAPTAFQARQPLCRCKLIALHERDHRRCRWRQNPALVRDESVIQYLVHHEPAQPRGMSRCGSASSSLDHLVGADHD
jgi:hypothetical protein